MRAPPEPLYGDVFDLATAITQASEADDWERYDEALDQLRAYYQSRLESASPDPFLTETLADYETDPVVKIELYRLALSQAGVFPDEPLYTKRTGLAECLIEIGANDEAKVQLDLAMPEAEEAHDDHQLDYIATLRSRVAV